MRRAAAALLALSLVGVAGPEARDDQLPGWFDLPVPGGARTLEGLGMTADERAVTLPVLARALYDRDQRLGSAQVLLTRIAADVHHAKAPATGRPDEEPADSARPLTVPAPLDADTWRGLLPPAAAPLGDDLFLRLVSDRHGLLLAAGLASTDPTTRAWLARDRDLLRFIYRQAAGAFVVVARHLRVDDGTLVVPGGPDAEDVWQALTGESPSRPAPFLRALLTKDLGRLAWYYDTVAGVDAARLAAIWPQTNARIDDAVTLYAAFRDSDPQWRLPEQPFRRGVNDAWMFVTQVDIRDGEVVSPLPQSAWDVLFASARVNTDQIRRALGTPATPMRMAWFAREALAPISRERRYRFESFRLAQRVFPHATPEQLPDVMLALNGHRHSRALLFALERMQIRDPKVWAAAVTAARHVSATADDQRTAVPVFQAAIALLERMRHVRTIDEQTAASLVGSLSTAAQSDRRVARNVSRWIVEALVPALPRLVRPDAWTGRTAYESVILQALAGPVERATASLQWEQLDYVADTVAAEHDRLRAMRELVPSPGLDEAMRSDRARDLADALTALVYVTALGEPDGPASLGPDVGTRHEFGLTGTAVIRDELPWAPPEERQGFGPWRVQGSLLGLDLGLSRLFLRRVADQQMPPAPTLTLNDVGTLTRTAVALVPSELEDADRDAIAEAIARGRKRVAAAASPTELDRLAAECGMWSAARQALPWVWSRQRTHAPHTFALRDLMWLGRPSIEAVRLDRWGVAADGIDGRRTTTMPRPASWEDFAGRSEAGQVSTQVPDLTLRLIEETARLRLPASLIPALLGFALEDYWHDVRARFNDDWPRLTQQAASVTAARIDDYVAALTGDGPLRSQ